MATSNKSAAVEFLGGPYDGLICERDAGDFPDRILELPVSLNVLRVMVGETPGRQVATKTLAKYRLLVTAIGYRYQHTGTRKAIKSELEELTEWAADAIRQWRRAQE